MLEHIKFGGMEAIPDAKFHLTQVSVVFTERTHSYLAKNRVEHLFRQGSRDFVHLPTTDVQYFYDNSRTKILQRNSIISVQK